jgi:hypothetical protein
MWTIEYRCRRILICGTRKECTSFVEARLVVKECIGEVEIAVEFVVVELYRDGIVCVLVYSPDKANEVET